jgi:hypothetical protein
MICRGAASQSGSTSASTALQASAPVAWAAAQAYVAMLQMPGAVAYGAFHTALMGKALTCLRQWCRTSPVHAPGTGKDSSAAASRYVEVDILIMLLHALFLQFCSVHSNCIQCVVYHTMPQNGTICWRPYGSRCITKIGHQVDAFAHNAENLRCSTFA